jgi:hypothetical protein
MKRQNLLGRKYARYVYALKFADESPEASEPEIVLFRVGWA